MKISIWAKYHLISFFTGIVTILLFLLCAIYIHPVLGLVGYIITSICRILLLHSIKCPKCKKPVDNWTTIFSGNNDGLFMPMSKICRTCGFNFKESECANKSCFSSSKTSSLL